MSITIRTTRSVAGDFWGGYCPDCLTVETEMLLNKLGNWECPNCHLQIEAKEKIVVLAREGVGAFLKRCGTRIAVSDVLPPQCGKIAYDLR